LEDYSERLVNRLPVTVRRRVRWGDCDPAGVVYTPVFAEYGVSGFNWLMDTLLGGPLLRESERLGVSTPFKALSLEFRSPLWPDQMFDMVCGVSDIRSRTFDIEIRALDMERNDVFVGRLTPIFIARSERRSVPIPDEIRVRLEDYRRQCEAQPAR
jgi:acyl-CoA thioester hydrolase